ncbi:MAG: hypothetical protein R3286_20370, partial [Gammaproteobacteria bacterium]|nr:hypothetical protein [Gammaproteobacteria bacterium]
MRLRAPVRARVGRWRRAALLATALALLGAGARAGAEDRTFLLVICGIGGEPELSARFTGWCEGMLDAAAGPELAIPRERMQYLSEATSVRADGRSVKSEVAQAIARLA